jgi:hypothetical protein
MALYQFTARDTAGAEKRGTIEAITPQEACAALQRHGLQPTQVFAVPPPAADFVRTPVPGYSAPRPPGRGVAVAGLILACLALLIAGAALGWQVWRATRPAKDKDAPDPLGKGLAAYDFSSPKNAFKSGLEMERDRDWRAVVELDKKRHGPELEEKLRTFQVRKEETWKGTVILFIEYEEKGAKKYTVAGFEKDDRSGLWLSKYVNSLMVQKDNPTLANQITNWQNKGQLN